MTKSTRQTEEMSTRQCFVAYDESTGEIVYVHTVMDEAGAGGDGAELNTPVAVRCRAAGIFEGRALKVIEVPADANLGQGGFDSVDVASGTLVASGSGPLTFREAVRRRDGP